MTVLLLLRDCYLLSPTCHRALRSATAFYYLPPALPYALGFYCRYLGSPGTTYHLRTAPRTHSFAHCTAPTCCRVCVTLRTTTRLRFTFTTCLPPLLAHYAFACVRCLHTTHLFAFGITRTTYWVITTPLPYHRLCCLFCWFTFCCVSARSVCVFCHRFLLLRTRCPSHRTFSHAGAVLPAAYRFVSVSCLHHRRSPPLPAPRHYYLSCHAPAHLPAPLPHLPATPTTCAVCVPAIPYVCCDTYAVSFLRSTTTTHTT